MPEIAATKAPRTKAQAEASAAPKVALRKLTDLTPDPRNARTHSPEQIEQLVASINRFGWTNPVLADDLIRAGHGRCMAAAAIYEAGGTIYLAPGKANGGKAITAGTVPVIDCTGWTEDERKAYALADNQLALQAGWDTEALMAQIDELVRVDFDLPTIGFDAAALDALMTDTSGADEADPGTTERGTGEMADTTFDYQEQFAVIVKCANAAEQEARFNALREQYGADNVKVVVV